jgi:hypothetical protein
MGTPSIPITPTFTFPSLSVYKNKRQNAITKINLVVLLNHLLYNTINGKYGIQQYNITSEPLFGEFVTPRLTKKEIMK